MPVISHGGNGTGHIADEWLSCGQKRAIAILFGVLFRPLAHHAVAVLCGSTAVSLIATLPRGPKATIVPLSDIPSTLTSKWSPFCTSVNRVVLGIPVSSISSS